MARVAVLLLIFSVVCACDARSGAPDTVNEDFCQVGIDWHAIGVSEDEIGFPEPSLRLDLFDAYGRVINATSHPITENEFFNSVILFRFATDCETSIRLMAEITQAAITDIEQNSASPIITYELLPLGETNDRQGQEIWERRYQPWVDWDEGRDQ